MPFLNIYNKQDNYFYTTSVISGKDFVYVVGKIEEELLVVKLDLLGDVIWEKSYTNSLGNGAPIKIHDVTECDNGDILIVTDSKEVNQHTFVITRINKNTGAVVWCKHYSFAYTGVITLTRVANEKYLLNTWGLGNIAGASAGITVVLLKIEFDGSVSAKRAVGMDVSQNNVYGAGRKHSVITSDSTYYYVSTYFGFLKLNSNLTIANKFRFGSPINIEEIRMVNGNLRIVAVGDFDGNNGVYYNVMLVSFPNTAINSQISVIRYANHGTTVTGNDDFLYLMHDYPNRMVQKIEVATKTILWSKKIDTQGDYDLHVTEDEIVYHDYQVSYWGAPSLKMIGVTNLDLQNCKVTPHIPFPDVLPTETLMTSDFNLISTDVFSVGITSGAHTVTNVSSVKTEQCGYPSIPLNDITMLQSSHLYLQSAGSLGFDSTKGIHLRWMLKNGLGSHLPKGNYATTQHNFNKPDDYVKIYRAPYVQQTTLVRLDIAPNSANDTSKTWTYIVGQKMFYVYFRSNNIYTQVRATVNPLANPEEFIQSYFHLNGVLEIENKNHLSFAVTSYFDSSSQGSIKVECLSVEENKPNAPKLATLRKTMLFNDIQGQQLLSENIRSIRFQSQSTYPLQVEFEFYADFLALSNSTQAWDEIGEHALSEDNTTVFQRLEPAPGLVDGKWLRYNDEAYVNLINYKTKWDGMSVEPEERILSTVKKYIELSDDANNPTAIQEYSYDEVPIDEEGDEEAASTFEISNLFLLHVGSLDYHVARMLGLGMLDYENEILNGKFVYAAEYVTFGDLNDGLGAREVRHVYLTLPTGIEDERLPLPIDLKEPVPGIFTGNEVESESITDADGYTPDGKSRFITLFNERLPHENANAAFFYKDYEFISAKNTLPVFAGVEYKKTEAAAWRKPELSYDGVYLNTDNTVDLPFQKSETIEIVIPDPGDALFIHREKQGGSHDYGSYGINWFSRAASSTIIRTIETHIVPANEMLPPTNVQAVYIQKERPLLFSSLYEQGLLEEIENEDKTMIRLSFEYNHGQELITYHQKIGNEIVPDYSEFPDNEEPFAEHLEIFFRNHVPEIISGKVQVVTDDANPLRSRIITAPYVLTSTAQDQENVEATSETIIPVIVSGTEANYELAVMVIDEEEYIVHSIDNSGQYPVFTVWKRYLEGSAINAGTSQPDGLIAPSEGGMFLIVENMQSVNSWNTPANTNPVSIDVVIDHVEVHRESILTQNENEDSETHINKFRGIYRDAVIKKINEDVEVYENSYDPPLIVSKHLGLYEITFPNYSLLQHSQFSESGDSVEFYNGVVRIHTQNAPNGTRKVFNVARTANIGVPGEDLALIVSDPLFPSDDQELEDYDGKLMADNESFINQRINYYPGYKVYLYADPSHGLTESQILPTGDEDIHYSVFGLRSYDNLYQYYSQLSVPALMFARKIEEPEQPRKPLGGLYATRPDFFDKSTYTFNTEFSHIPYSIQFSRASDTQILSVLYNADTLQDVRQNIFMNGEEEFYMSRWENLLSFEYGSGKFEVLPEETGVRLPLPDNPKFITAINEFIKEHNRYYESETDVPYITVISSLNYQVIPATPLHGALYIYDFLKDVIHNCFVPLTEIPVLYQYIKGAAYTPIPKKQVVRDRNGNLLKASDAEFDMAPMMKVVSAGSNPVVQFTDYGLDGASRAKYLYVAREINLQMKVGPYSDILGPVSLVNTNPPPAPEIVKVTSVLENKALNVDPAIRFEINSYPEVQGISQINVYRTATKEDALSVRTMDLVKIIDIENEDFLTSGTWIFEDEFEDLDFIPYGDILYYRIVVLRKIAYNDSDSNLIVDHTPSEASKLIITNIVNNYIPDSPVVLYYSEPVNQGILQSVILSWEKTVYNGKYHVYKMNSQGNWTKMHEVVSNLDIIYLPIGDLVIEDDNDNALYHHYKVLAENYSGMISTKENVLTIYNYDTWRDIGGVGDMILEGTFIVRQ